MPSAWFWAPAVHVLSACIYLLAALPGMGLAAAAIPVVRAFGPTNIRGFADVRLDSEVLAFCALLRYHGGALRVGIGYGLTPGYRDPHGGSSTRPHHDRQPCSPSPRRCPDGASTGLAMVLVTGAGLIRAVSRKSRTSTSAINRRGCCRTSTPPQVRRWRTGSVA